MRTRACFVCLLVSSLALTVRIGAAIIDHQVIQIRPVQMGTSGGNLNDRDKAGSFCCSGTLGSLVTDGNGTFYILGNNHALAKVNKGRKGLKGDFITQPGLVDADCLLGPSNGVARLTTFVPLKGSKNKVDAALAKIISSNEVDVTGQILEIGQPSTEILSPALGSLVMKSGRTTGLTTGSVVAIDASFAVESSGCSAKKLILRKFEGQIIVGPNTFGNFAQGGDSGSLVLEAAGPCPRPVGLLFAGSASVTAVNPIGAVLSALSLKLKKIPLSIVGCAPGGLGITSAQLTAESKSSYGIEATAFKAATAARRHHESRLSAIAGVVGTAVGRQSDNPSQATVEILVEKDSPELRSALPTSADGVPCHVIETGKFVAF